MIVALGCDHAGFVLKAAVKDFFDGKAQVTDFGVFGEERCDYPDVALPAARAVSEGKADLGVLLCGTGIGMSIAANKVAGIRAAACFDVESARLAKAHNNLNVLCMGGRVIAPDHARAILKAWFETSFEAGAHLVRIGKIAAAEPAADA
jgi:ribose 5-phosphate isomerase B